MKEKELEQMLSELGYASQETREIPTASAELSHEPSGRKTELREAEEPEKEPRRPEGKFEVSPPPDALDMVEPLPLSEEAKRKREAYLRMLETDGTGELEELEEEAPPRRGVLAGFVMFAMVVDVLLLLVFGVLFSVAVSVEKNPDYMLLSRRLFFAEERISSFGIAKGDLVIFQPVTSGGELKVNDLVLCGDGRTNRLAFVSGSEGGSVTIRGLDGQTVEGSGLFVKGKYDCHSPFFGVLFGQVYQPSFSSLLFLLPLILLILLPIYSMVRREN